MMWHSTGSRKAIYLSMLGIVIGELLILLNHAHLGLAIYIINLQAVTLIMVLSKYPSEIKNVLQTLLLLFLMRIINLAMPQLFTVTLLWYPLVYGVMFIPIYYITQHQNITSGEIGIDFRRLNVYIPLAFLIGAIMALLEFQILHPVSLIVNLKIQNLILVATVMFIFVAAVEELIFRSILLTRLEKLFSGNQALLLGAFLFGMMHAIYGVLNEVIFATFFGIVLGFIFQKTRSFPFILLIHGTANVLLFGILPIL